MNGYCYTIHTTALEWDTAQMACSIYGRLAPIRSQTQFDAMLQLMADKYAA